MALLLEFLASSRAGQAHKQSSSNMVSYLCYHQNEYVGVCGMSMMEIICEYKKVTLTRVDNN